LLRTYVSPLCDEATEREASGRAASAGRLSVFVSASLPAAFLQGPRPRPLREKHSVAVLSHRKSPPDGAPCRPVTSSECFPSLVSGLHFRPLSSQELCPSLDVLFSPPSPASHQTAASSPNDKVRLMASIVRENCDLKAVGVFLRFF